VFAETGDGVHELKVFAEQARRGGWDGSRLAALGDRFNEALLAAKPEELKGPMSDHDHLETIKRIDSLINYQIIGPDDELKSVYINIPDAVVSNTKLLSVMRYSGRDYNIGEDDVEEHDAASLSIESTGTGAYRITSPLFDTRPEDCCYVRVAMPLGTSDRLYQILLLPKTDRSASAPARRGIHVALSDSVHVLPGKSVAGVSMQKDGWVEFAGKRLAQLDVSTNSRVVLSRSSPRRKYVHVLFYDGDHGARGGAVVDPAAGRVVVKDIGSSEWVSWSPNDDYLVNPASGEVHDKVRVADLRSGTAYSIPIGPFERDSCDIQFQEPTEGFGWLNSHTFWIRVDVEENPWALEACTKRSSYPSYNVVVDVRARRVRHERL